MGQIFWLAVGVLKCNHTLLSLHPQLQSQQGDIQYNHIVRTNGGAWIGMQEEGWQIKKVMWNCNCVIHWCRYCADVSHTCMVLVLQV